jgi:hypothetical protein
VALHAVVQGDVLGRRRFVIDGGLVRARPLDGRFCDRISANIFLWPRGAKTAAGVAKWAGTTKNST